MPPARQVHRVARIPIASGRRTPAPSALPTMREITALRRRFAQWRHAHGAAPAPRGMAPLHFRRTARAPHPAVAPVPSKIQSATVGQV
jgi:hypothetical protein